MAVYPPEPFRIKMVEPIKLIGRAERQVAMKRAGYNVFGLLADEIYIVYAPKLLRHFTAQFEPL